MDYVNGIIIGQYLIFITATVYIFSKNRVSIKSIVGRPPINPALFFSMKVVMILLWSFPLMRASGIGLFFFTHPVSDIIGLIIMGAGFAIAGSSIARLGKSTRLGISDEVFEFARTGLYSVSRNPMYCGFFIISLGAAVITLSIIGLIMAVYVISVTHLVVLAEEKFLDSRLQDDWREYKKLTPRYLVV